MLGLLRLRRGQRLFLLLYNRYGFDLVLKGGIAEALLGKAAMHWHLATFKARTNGGTGTRQLTFVPAARGLAMAGALATADALATVFRTRAGCCIVKSHEMNGGLKLQGGLFSHFLATSTEDLIAHAQLHQGVDRGLHHIGVVA